MRPGAVAFAASGILLMSTAAGRADERLRWGLRLEAGAEHDTNPARLERVDGATPRPIASSAVGRLVLAGDLLGRFSDKVILTLGGSGAGKLFARDEVRAEDVAIGEARGAVTYWAGATTALSLSGGYYDVFQRGTSLRDARAFRSVAPSARFEQVLGNARVHGGAGYRWFLFKAAREFDFSGPTGFVGYRHLWPTELGEDGADWEWSLGGSVEARRFESVACPSLENCPPPQPAERRRDLFTVVSTELVRTGDALLGAALAAHLNRSNSFSERLARLIGHARGVFLLPWDISLAVRAELVLTRYEDAVPVGQRPMGALVSIDDEGRSTLRVELTRGFGRLVEAGLRYSLYTSAFADGPVSFRRQTLLGFVALSLER